MKTTRQRSAPADELALEEDEEFLRPPAPERRTRRRAAPDLVPNYDPALDSAPIQAQDPAQDAERFLRARRRVAPRRGGHLRRLSRTRPGRILLGTLAFALLAALAWCAAAVLSFLRNDPHFRIDSSSSILATGITELPRTALVNVFGSDIGRNIFFVPLARREAALEAEPWVRHATVMRVLPSSIHVAIQERTPVAFARLGHRIELVDADGVLLPMAPATLAARHYSFPVVVGLDPTGPAPARASRMRLYQRFVAALDSGGARVSSQLSEVDLSDLDDVRAVVSAPGTDLLLHFGNSDFLERWRSYQEHLPEWRQQYPNLSAIDLRYDRQVVLKMADAAAADASTESASNAPKAAPAHPAAATKHATSRASTTHHTAHPNQPPGTWYTEKRIGHHPGPQKHVQWVPHYNSNAGRAQ